MVGILGSSRARIQWKNVLMKGLLKRFITLLITSLLLGIEFGVFGWYSWWVCKMEVIINLTRIMKIINSYLLANRFTFYYLLV